MAYLDPYTVPLTASKAAHLLRRATFGPTKSEIEAFTGLNPGIAVDQLFANVVHTASPPPPVDITPTSPNYLKPLMSFGFVSAKSGEHSVHLRYWWLGLMMLQNGKPSVLEKITAFWQNHFVVSQNVMADYRYMYRYLKFLRDNSLGNFKTMTIGITKDPAMLIYQNGAGNNKTTPNENYARELQELFTVGQQDFYGNLNYTEADVKAASKVLTGWMVTNYYANGTSEFTSNFHRNYHDTSNKTFSSKYGGVTIQGRTDDTAGDVEMNELIDMLLRHPEAPKHICRKLYRWYVNQNVTEDIENNVIVPLAAFFSSSENNYNIKPVLEKLLKSEIFFADQNVGSIIKSPMEYLIGMGRFFEQPCPDMMTDTAAYTNYIRFFLWGMAAMNLEILNQPLVFGYPPYYQVGYSKNWINGSTITARRGNSDRIIFPTEVIKPGYTLGIDFLAWIQRIQPNFSDSNASPAITPAEVLAAFSENLFAIELTEAQKTYLIDVVFMRNLPHTSWRYELNGYRNNPTSASAQTPVKNRCSTLMRYMVRMAEYEVF
ncbi:Uncharacterized conserved protein, DUF1800 family [Dyadobacter soli]|uniref:Uncharacterized conserved protein, DUF1800 family n=1 Tax=Dyadobacter soli TaxID=659014 RepID=A0A1G7UXY4_9BACT|nr:DUF1800 domain-containing protein [Dyadobacter soli]SDG52412.1 Uncharacterized conserved protein, DUF1800 family [Dyadobacter soli]